MSPSSSASTPGAKTRGRGKGKAAAKEGNGVGSITVGDPQPANGNNDAEGNVEDNSMAMQLHNEPEEAAEDQPQSTFSANVNYANSHLNLDDITIRQLDEDIRAYEYDLRFCTSTMEQGVGELTPQEMRTLQLRTLDLGHQIRHARHRIEKIEYTTRHGPPGPGAGLPLRLINGSASGASGRQSLPALTGKRATAFTAAAVASRKRSLPGEIHVATPLTVKDNGGYGMAASKRMKTELGSPVPSPRGGSQDDENDEGVMDLTRLGFWECRLCKSQKYQLAGEGRQPSAPGKWPLKDISKMITHYTELHGEHNSTERCMELGAALHVNRGPFEYWLRRSRSQKIEQDTIDMAIDELQNGTLPDILRKLSRAAATFPK